MIATRFNPLGTKPMYPSMRYVQDGLVHQWDGIENVGFGKHDSSSSMWKDLIGTYDAILSDVATFDDNSLTNASDAYGTLASSANQILNATTMEIVYKVDNLVDGDSLVFHANETAFSHLFLVRRDLIAFSLTYSDGAVRVATVGKKTSTVGIYESPIGDDAGTTAIYVNGSSLTVSRTSGGAAVTEIRFGGQGATSRRFRGNIYAVRIYNRALTDDEIAHNYAIDKERFGL